MKKFNSLLANEIQKEFVKLVDLIEKVPSLTFDKIGVWKWCTLPSGKEWPLSKWVTVNTKSPYKKAAALIRKII